MEGKEDYPVVLGDEQVLIKTEWGGGESRFVIARVLELMFTSWPLSVNFFDTYLVRATAIRARRSGPQ